MAEDIYNDVMLAKLYIYFLLNIALIINAQQEIAHQGLGNKVCKILLNEKSVDFAKLIILLAISKNKIKPTNTHKTVLLAFLSLFLNKNAIAIIRNTHKASVKICAIPQGCTFEALG